MIFYWNFLLGYLLTYWFIDLFNQFIFLNHFFKIYFSFYLNLKFCKFNFLYIDLFNLFIFWSFLYNFLKKKPWVKKDLRWKKAIVKKKQKTKKTSCQKMVVRRDNIVMLKLPQPKRVILPSSRTFMAKWERSKKKICLQM